MGRTSESGPAGRARGGSGERTGRVGRQRIDPAAGRRTDPALGADRTPDSVRGDLRTAAVPVHPRGRGTGAVGTDDSGPAKAIAPTIAAGTRKWLSAWSGRRLPSTHGAYPGTASFPYGTF